VLGATTQAFILRSHIPFFHPILYGEEIEVFHGPSAKKEVFSAIKEKALKQLVIGIQRLPAGC